MGLYLGFDFSTQSLKCMSTREDDEIHGKFTVNFDEDLPQFRTTGGVHFRSLPDGGVEVTSPPLMWITALDLLLDRMLSSKFPFHCVKAISVSAQQHGTVYWAQKIDDRLGNLDATKPLSDQLKGPFTFEDSPVWMDSSTGVECAEMEEFVRKESGGLQSLSTITGAKAYERFAGPQIRKRWKRFRSKMLQTEAVSLVSSFASTLLLGRLAPIDASDSAGTNLVDVKSRNWAPICLNACAVDEESRRAMGMMLQPPCPSDQVLGRISPFFASKYGFSSDCAVVAATGDNPSSLAGTRMKEGDIVVSLGTSDTIFLWLPQDVVLMSGRRESKEGFVLPNPIDRAAFMAMLVFKNGSLCREKIWDAINESSTECHCATDDPWAEFDRVLVSSPAGNNGFMGIFFHEEEITPKAKGVFRFDAQDVPIEQYPPPNSQTEVRALIEGQFLAKRCHAEDMGFQFTGPESTRILATGGASQNLQILQVLADVMNTAVFVLENSDSASLGAAFRAKHALAKSGNSELRFQDVISSGNPSLAAQPNATAAAVYRGMAGRYRKLEKSISQSCQSGF